MKTASPAGANPLTSFSKYITMPWHYYVAPVFIAIILLDILRSRLQNKSMYDWKDLMTNIAIGVIGFGIANLIKRLLEFIFFIFIFDWSLPIRKQWLGYESLGWHWGIWILAYIGDDFTYYWHHRWSHRIRILWAAHVVHHSSSFFNFSTGLRNGWVVLLYKHFWWIWMPLAGFEPLMVTTVLIINALYQFAMHVQYNGRFIFPETLFISPALHQVHHARNASYIDKNYGGTFSVWDRLFGTFQAYDIQPEFGITKKVKSHNPFYLHIHEFLDLARDVRQAGSLREALKYIFGTPGWHVGPSSPDQLPHAYENESTQPHCSIENPTHE